MPTGIRPRVNEAREFLEIAKDFKDPKEIIREAISNSWDAGASKVILKFDLVRIHLTRRKKIVVEIIDDGEGMSSAKREGISTNEIEDFFNLGDSNKPYGSIGTKGHGTKIYYKSNGIIVDTWKNGKHIHAETEVAPWFTLRNGNVPTYKYDEDSIEGKGTRIIVDGFEGKQSEIAYFETKKNEDDLKEQEKQKEKEVQKKEETKNELEQRLNEYKGRPDLIAPDVTGSPLKEPKSEAETALLLQAMISSKHHGIDFTIGEYKTLHGTDLIVEYKNKGIPSFAWAEIVVTLENLFTWLHPPEGIHKVICWELGNVQQKQFFGNGKEAILTKKGHGRYHLDIGIDSIEVYVLREILQEE